MIKYLKTLILKAEGGFSWTKFYYWVTTVCGIIALLPGEMTSLGLTVTPRIQHIVIIAGLVSFLVAGIRNRNASSSGVPNSAASVVQAPTSNVTDAPKA